MSRLYLSSLGSSLGSFLGWLFLLGASVFGSLAIGPATAQAESWWARILLGQPTDQFPAVGIVGSLQRGGFCSGTLISPTHVMTAAHCAEVIPDAMSGTFEANGRVSTTTSVFIHPDYNGLTLDNDIAILVLSEPVLDIEPEKIFRGVPLVGDTLTIVGFGSGGDETGAGNDFGTKRLGTTTIDEVTATLVSWVFDDVNESNSAPGDSGGPGFIDVAGEFTIAAIISGGTEPDAAFGDMAFNTRVDAYADWIDQTLVAADAPTDSEDPASDEWWEKPFPLLQLLIDMLTQLLDLLTQAADMTCEDPTTPTEPTEPTEPIEPTEPTTPTEPTEPTTPTEPSNPATQELGVGAGNILAPNGIAAPGVPSVP